MQTANIHYAKTYLSRLLKEVSQGEEIIIAKAGKPVAKIVPIKEQKNPRVPGALRGEIWVSDDFDETSPELIKSFYGQSK